MKKMLRLVLVAAVASFAAIPLATAQGSSQAALVTVPFKFIVGDKLLPAGTYQIWSESSDWEMMKISRVGTTSAAATVRTWPMPNSAVNGSNVHVQFKNYFGQYFLEWVQLPLSDVHTVKITTLQAARTLARLNLMPAEQVEIAK